MLARSELKTLGSLVKRLNSSRSVRPPIRVAITELANELSRDKMGEMPTPILLAEVAQQLLSVVSKADWESLPLKTRRLAPWALWTGTPEPIRTRGILGSCRDDAINGSIGRIQAMISSYIVNCDQDRPGLGQFGAAIRTVLAKRDHEALRKWKDRDAEYSFFDPEEGPRVIANSLMNGAETTAELHRIGVGESIFEGSQYVVAIHKRICELISKGSGTQSDGRWFDRLIRFFQDDGGELRVRHGRAQLATSLLEPWSKGVAPAPELRVRITNFLLRHLRDPRLYLQNWQGVSSSSIEVFRRWLNQLTLEQFFDLISDRNESDQWPYRRAFWTAVLRAGIIEDSLVVLNPKAREAAGRLVKDIKCGELRGSGAGERSVILLRVGPLIFSEVSHNAALHAWKVSDPKAPRLDGNSYDWEQVYSPALDFPDSAEPGSLWHRKPERGLWQGRAAELIRQYTGVRIERRDWQPR